MPTKTQKKKRKKGARRVTLAHYSTRQEAQNFIDYIKRQGAGNDSREIYLVGEPGFWKVREVLNCGAEASISLVDPLAPDSL